MATKCTKNTKTKTLVFFVTFVDMVIGAFAVHKEKQWKSFFVNT